MDEPQLVHESHGLRNKRREIGPIGVERRFAKRVMSELRELRHPLHCIAGGCVDSVP